MSATDVSYPAILQQVMQADQYPLRRAWQRLQQRSLKQSATNRSQLELEQWHARAEASKQLCLQRAASIPSWDYDEELPITSHRKQIVELLKTRQTMVICGETGSGKSTQLPKFCLEAGFGISGLIGHTQPRRLAARAIADRVADELHSQVGQLVGFKIRFGDTTSERTLIKLMTDGILLAETQSDRFLDQYDALIIDEAHERSLNIDFLLGLLRRILVRRPALRLIITSATIDPERFANHFADDQGPAPIVEVSGRTYPVEVRYRPLREADEDESSGEGEQEQAIAIAKAIDELWSEGSGDVLTFLPTERHIRVAAKYLRGHFANKGQDRQTEILPLYARLSHAEQNRIFSAHAKQRIILATNVAESSLTVPGIRFVIDSGLVRISRYAPRTGVRRLPIEAISQASANQRSGRCGRLGPGVCIRLFSEEDFQSRTKFTTPEIRRSDLASVLLQSHMLRLGPLEDFPLMDAPNPDALRDAKRTLQELEAIDAEGRLTPVGKQLGALPCDPRVGRILIEAADRGCLADAVIIAAAMECQDVRQRPAGQRTQADEVHAQFKDPHSDFLSFLRLWDFYQNLRSQLGRSRLEKALRKNYLSFHGYREWSDVVRQLKELLVQGRLWSRHARIELIPAETVAAAEKQQSQNPSDRRSESKQKKLQRPKGYDAIHQSLLAGLLRNIALKGDRHEYRGAGGLSLSIWPGSGLFRRPPKWMLVAEIVETSRRYGRTVAEIEAEWIEAAGQTLLKHSYHDPYWSSKQGCAMVYRRSTLFGLPVVSGRRTRLAPIDPDSARQWMIEQGLVGGQWKCQEEFYQHNLELLEDMTELTHRTRSREFIVDRYDLINFYTSRLPNELVDLASLKRWVSKNRGTEIENRLWLSAEDLLPAKTENLDVEQSFPNQLQVGANQFPLNYQYEPGGSQDGVTITVPQAALRQLSQERLEWLVSGMLEEKILFLIKSLPKNLRTNFLPAPDAARRLSHHMRGLSRDVPFSKALCDALQEYSGERIQPSDFSWDKLPEHLRFLIQVVDDQGHVIGQARQLEQLQHRLATDSGELPVASSDDAWENKKVTAQSFSEIPEMIEIRRGGLRVAAYPALVDVGEAAELRLVDTSREAQQQSQLGLVRLFALKHAKSLRSQVSHLPNLNKCSVQLANLLPTKILHAQLGDLIARLAFVENRPLVRERTEFEARDAAATSSISRATQEVAAWLPKLAEQYHAVRLKTETAPSMWQEVIDDIRVQQAQLFRASWLRDTPWQMLNEYPRFLQAMLFRIDKLAKGGLPKDRQLRAFIEDICQSIQQLKPANLDIEAFGELNKLRWMLEEYRISVFAQQLGTKISVSEKKLKEQLQLIQH